MKRFCPNCGKPVDPDEKFCSSCGQNLVNRPQAVNNSQLMQAQPQSQTINTQVVANARPRKSKKWLILSIIVALLVVGGGTYAYKWHKDNQEVQATVDKMSKRRLAGLTITYAHLHYRDNEAWNKTYQEAMNGNVDVERYKKYTIGDSTITAKGDNYVYVINKRAVFTTDNDKENSKSDLILADGRKELGRVKTTDAYKEVKKQDLQTLNKINKVELTNRQLGILAARLHSPQFVKDAIQLPKLSHPMPNYSENEQDGFSEILAGGAGAGASLFYKQDGNSLVIKYADVEYAENHGKAAAEAPIRTKRFNLSDVINKYYSTSQQKEEVDNLADQLRDGSQVDSDDDGEE
ncbi:hypothetical protein GCM10022297_16520 [Lactobacillus hamsteri]|uniref:Uncharacterized protein n=1 Tax=Lactobacillus hamsteri DSM 5661 = JCM 6256 TaxID=1423754 RepID=A0A0R1YFS2_9LACO|nr:DUF2116 family Zn-ribbon domain-containing protein [Lactobacillus hamsteri]KRM40821.1 hypothetical protein FC39_GL000016 [Lactobacillus hamsteri DSM 5661 = JCM 6256]